MKYHITCVSALVLPHPASSFVRPSARLPPLQAVRTTAGSYYHDSRIRKRPLIMSQAVELSSLGRSESPLPRREMQQPTGAKESLANVSVYDASKLGRHFKVGSKVINLYGLLFATQAWATAALMFPFCFLAGVLSAVFDWGRMRAPTAVARFWGRRVMLNMGVRPKLEGQENLPRAGAPAVLVVNHGSYLDIPVTNFLPLLPKYLMKAELLWLPIVGWKAVLSRDIFVHRQTATTFRKLLKATTRSLKAGNSILTFPEGTRSRDGRLGQFKRGPFTMAQIAGVPIVPVTITGVQREMPPFALAPFSKPRDVKLVVHPAIPTKGRQVKAVMAEAQKAVSDSLEEWQKPCDLIEGAATETMKPISSPS